MAVGPAWEQDGIGAAIAEAVPRGSYRSPPDASPYARFTRGNFLRSKEGPVNFSSYPAERLFETQAGRTAVRLFENDTRVLPVLNAISAEIVADWLKTALGPGVGPPALAGEGPRTELEPLIVQHAGQPGAALSLLILDPDYVGPPDRLTDELVERLLIDNTPAGQGRAPGFEMAIRRMAMRPNIIDPAVGGLLQSMMYETVPAAAEILWATQPEIVLARAPEMEYVGCPSPALEVVCNRAIGGPATSSVGIFCRDADGTAGLTACYHGTGPVGTAITVGGLPTRVTLADPVQDLVFAPLPPGYVVPNFTLGHGWARADRPPWQGEPVFFEGCTSGRKPTVVTGHGLGLLWREPASQNKIQTPPAVDPGDSGSALIDSDDKVLGFAFRRTRYGEAIPFAEWIWADNALAALGLTQL